tara:strand:+ start:218 stop:1177 length:960 start_codon:yes stop_codon:yes gene_type:complete
MDEFNLIKKYLKNLSFDKSSTLQLNDDVFFDKKNSIVVSVDTYNEGTHFINFNKPNLVIKKILRSSISDLVCKGVYPKYYFISASGNKKSFRNFNLKKIVQSLRAEQNKFKIILGGGDTVFSDKLSFTITSLGISKDIIYRNKAKFKDDIYVTGNLGDSYVGLLVLKNKIQVNVALKKYFVNKYYLPNIKFSLITNLKKIANTSIDISDGLFADMEKLINNQNLSYQIFLEKIPISSNLSEILKKKKLLKENFISNGDDYEILFTANKKNRNLIKKIARKSKTKITRIGYIKKNTTKSSILNALNSKIILKNKGYFHTF